MSHPVHFTPEEQIQLIPGLIPGLLALLYLVQVKVPVHRTPPTPPKRRGVVHRQPPKLDRGCSALLQVGRGGGGTRSVVRRRSGGGGSAPASGCSRRRRCCCRCSCGCRSRRIAVGGRDPGEDDIEHLGRMGGLLGAVCRLGPDRTCSLQGTDLALVVSLAAYERRAYQLLVSW